MSTVGQSTITTVGRSPRVSADGRPEVKQVGISIDWSSVAAVSGADVALDDGVTVKIGEKYLRYGQVVCEITGGEITTLTFTDDSAGDTFTITVDGDTTAAIAYDADAAAIDAALELLDSVGADGVAVTGDVGGPFTLTFTTASGDRVVTATGTGMTVTVATTSEGGRTGRYGPYDSAAVDGRQTLTPGSCFVLNSTVKENDSKSDHAGVALYGGPVFKARVRAHASSASLANGPTWADLLAALPRLHPVV